MIRLVLRAKVLTILLALAALAATLWPARQIGGEFMPTLNEGTLLYMPATLPGSVGDQGGRAAADSGPDHQELSRKSSRSIGKAGRAETATDPAPLEMFETVINLKAEGAMARRHDHRQADRRDGRGACSFRVCPTPGPCRSRRASTCCRPAFARPSASRCSARDLAEIEDVAAPGRKRGQESPGHQQRLCRARHRRLLPRHRARADRSWRATA